MGEVGIIVVESYLNMYVFHYLKLVFDCLFICTRGTGYIGIGGLLPISPLIASISIIFLDFLLC